ncbi:MAG TPA: hypothetical protein VKE53_00575 [Pseudolabrys sp.]|nr:hypothetical protein [Pseudolabrys sp.]
MTLTRFVQSAAISSKPIDYRGIPAMVFNQARDAVRTGAATAITGHAQHFELADEIAEYDRAVAGVLPQHSPLHRLGFGLKRFEKGGGHSQRHNMRVFVIFCSVAAMALLVFAHLSPAKWKPRTGLGGPIDHFLAYFAVTSIVCFAWPWPLVVGAVLMAVSALLEALQSFTPDRTPSFLAALCGAVGAVAAALIAELLLPHLKAFL